MSAEKREPWWTWHWDTAEGDIQWAAHVKRWRLGSLLTVYRHDTSIMNIGSRQWWIYGPFNLNIGVQYER
jgi:hypothetical protein